MFAIKYACLFDFILSAVDIMRYPILLAGTSNHFKSKILKELCGWVSYNVTEDAVLDLRIAAANYKTQIVESYTYEKLCLF